jgi:hypothetical protein
MKKEDLGFLTYTPEQVIEQTLAAIGGQLADLERERILMDGRIEALRSIRDNMEYMKNHRS